MTVFEYHYKPRVGVIGLACLFFLVVAFILAEEAIHNDRGLIIDAFIRLDRSEATGFFWALSALSLLFTLAGATGLFVSRRNYSFLRLTDKEVVIVPPSFENLPESIPAKNIIPFITMRKATVQTIKNQTFVTLYHDAGKFSVIEKWFDNKTQYQDFLKNLIQRCPQFQNLTAITKIPNG